MFILKKVISSALVAVLGLSVAVCPCAAMAGNDDSGDAHAHHQQTNTAPEESDCRHSGCANDCISVEAVTPDLKVLLHIGTSQQDDVAETKRVVSPSSTATVAVTRPPPGRNSLPPDTPVRRRDRLHI